MNKLDPLVTEIVRPCCTGRNSEPAALSNARQPAPPPAEYRLHHTSPDYRRNPKTNRFCALCQRDILGPSVRAYALDGPQCLVHPADAAAASQAGGDVFVVELGPECAKLIPQDFRISGNHQPGE
jgi:hypothetical protein